MARLSRYLKFSPVLLLAGSLGLNVYLGWQLRGGSVRPKFSPVAAGVRAPPLVGDTLEGGRATLEWATDKRPTVLYIFSPYCGWCKKNLPDVTALAEKSSREYRFIGLAISSSGLDRYVAANHFPLPVYTNPEQSFIRTLRLGPTPETIMISPEGRVVRSWIGAYVGRVRQEVEAAFHVRLPAPTK